MQTALSPVLNVTDTVIYETNTINRDNVKTNSNTHNFQTQKP